ncbi:ADP-ribosyltransferase domain-containing protein [Nocardia farcinica]|uniref:ADP-ribosyltransferase domain-containing protein n=1 Tax=Nocardia farcinica TaxID=37329 RepID=UPI001E53F49A|nr:ADP-ribosyltransferase domain-containing protein [Nocardia farcinica]
MKANGNRRLNRLARKKVVDHLKELGLVETAAAVQAAPPSILAELMTGLGIDPKILGDTPMPSTHSNPPSAKLLIAQGLAERQKLEAPQPTLAETRVMQAEAQFDEAKTEFDEARKAVRRAQHRLRVTKQKAEEDPSLTPDIATHEATLQAAKQAFREAEAKLGYASDDLAYAKFGLREDMEPAERDAYCATLTDDEIDAIIRSVNRTHTPDAESALAFTGGAPALAGRDRDTSVYVHATLPLETGDGITMVEGRALDGGTAIYRRGSGDFVILQRKGEAYFPVATAGSKSNALAKANRIPIFTGLAELPPDATDMQRQAHDFKGKLIVEVATQAANGTVTSTEGHQKLLDKGMAGAVAELADSVGGGVVRAEIYDGVKRHKRAMREKAAHEAGEKARAAALASGASKAQAEQAYAKARRMALGTPTRGGGVIPHFDHKIPPESLGTEKSASLTRSGIRAWGVETAEDYSVIAKRAGDLKAWGFTDSTGKVKTSDITTLTSQGAQFIKAHLTTKERQALTTYTGGSYMKINAAITGRDSSPSPHTKSVVAQLESGFDKFREHNANTKPMTLLRGSRVPSGWKGTPSEYLAAAFKPGSRVEIGKVTSCTTSQSTALAFTGHPPYVLAIRTRDGLPVKSISQYSSENEVIIPPGTQLRCVKVENNGIGGKPTVYLVAEDLVAEDDDHHGLGTVAA